MTSSARPVTFTNRQGHVLAGILHEPSPARHDCAIILLAAGVKARVGPHGLYPQLARAFLEHGFPVLRFDFWGLGDSEGTASERLLADLYGSVSCGRYVDDTKTAVAWTCETLGVSKVILAGLCGGAITGLLAGAGDPRVAGLLGLGLPISVDGSNVDKVKYMSIGQLEGIRSKYVRKLMDFESWKRLLTMKTDFRLLLRALTAPLKRRPASKPVAATEAPDDNTNPYFRPSLLKMIDAKQPVLLIFSESDRLYWEFRERFVDRYQFDVAAHPDVLEVAIVKNANHIFTFKEWQLDMLGRAAAWLQERFPSPTHVSHAASHLVSRRAFLTAIPPIVALHRPGSAVDEPAGRRATGMPRFRGEPVQSPLPAQNLTPRPIVLLGASYALGWQLPAIAGRPVVNKGVSGQESWELLERFDRDVIAMQPSAVILWGYINDVFRSSRDQMDAALARARDSFEQMVRKSEAAGIEVILASEIFIRAKDDWRETIASWVGWAMGKESYQDYINGRVAELNVWLRQKAIQDRCLLLDLQPVLADASSPRRKDSADGDGSHISPAGYAALTAYTVPRLEQHFREAVLRDPPH
jgi:uncharacterized protein